VRQQDTSEVENKKDTSKAKKKINTFITN